MATAARKADHKIEIERNIMSEQWFTVDKAGLGKQAEQQSKGRLIGELIQNALDEG